MVSEVEGELRDGVGDADLLRATFPPGSVTGAPKLAALRRDRGAGVHGREAYTGAIGFASPLAGLELSVAIRSVRGPRRAHLARRRRRHRRRLRRRRTEAREAAAKAAPLLAAIGAQPPPGAGAEAVPRRRLASCGAGRGPTPRPDPARGALRDGPRRAAGCRGSRRAPRAARGQRCARSTAGAARAIWPSAPRAARGHERARLRIDVVPGEDAAVVVTRAAPTRGPRAAPGRRCPAASGRTSGATARCWRRTRPTTPRRSRCCSTPTASCWRRAARASSSAPRTARCTRRRADGRILPGVTVAGRRARRGCSRSTTSRAAEAVYVTSALRGLAPPPIRSSVLISAQASARTPRGLGVRAARSARGRAPRGAVRAVPRRRGPPDDRGIVR